MHAAGGGFLAVYRRCTHLGCSVNWEAEQNSFFCPCHASTFDMHGEVESPTAPRTLDTFPVQIEASQVLVDTAKLIFSEIEVVMELDELKFPTG